MDKTLKKSLVDQFNRQAASNRRCLAFAQKALDEKRPEAARLFKALARSATIQGANLLKAASGIGTTTGNFTCELRDTSSALLDVLPEEINRAQALGEIPAKVALEQAHASALSIAELLEEAIAQEGMADIRMDALHVCSICGFLVQGEAPDVCPCCGVNKKLLPAVE